MSGRTKLIVALPLLAVAVVAAFVLPIPTPAELRTWATGNATTTALLLLLAYSVLAVFPIPRTFFNLAAGLLLGNLVGITVAMAATAIAASLAFGLARLLGRDLVSRHLHRKWVRTVNERLSEGGVLAITSLRLIPMAPFAPLNYCCGISLVRFGPYLLGTALGSLPGTVAVVLLGDALTGNTPPELLACYGVFAILGTIGLVKVFRKREAVEPQPEYAA
jgi:uncharacterized membrane protein YdjX (TVP38/TMEM64 family)